MLGEGAWRFPIGPAVAPCSMNPRREKTLQQPRDHLESAISSTAAGGSHLPFELFPEVSSVETDRFCDSCGYNLHGQTVRRDPRLEILLSRCPECGRFQAVADGVSIGRKWLRRLTVGLLLVWVAGAVMGFIALTAGQVGVNLALFDELTRTHSTVVQPATSGTALTYQFQTVVKSDYDDYELLMATTGVASFGLALLVGALAVVVTHHWRRRAHYALVIGQALFVAVLVDSLWSLQAPDLAGWAIPYICLYAGLRLFGGALGVCSGRPLARGLVRMVLPPRLRPPLAFLWTCDGLVPPICCMVNQPHDTIRP